jgi:tetratricopeptide (TPR) repeat protein
MHAPASCAAVVFFMLACGPLSFAQDAGDQAKQLVAKAQELAHAKDFVAAIAHMEKAIPLAPGNDLYLAMTSDYELKAGRFSDGVEHAMRAIKLNDKDGGYFVIAAANAYGGQDLERTRSLCEKVLNKGPMAFGLRACQDAQFLRDLTIEKEYTLFWNLDPKRGRMINGAFAVCLPKNGLPYQSVTYEIGDVKSHRLIKGDVNDVLSVVPQGMKPFPLTIKVTTQPYSYKKELAKAVSKPPPPEAKAFLGPIYAVDPKSPTLKKVVAGFKGDDAVATVRNILAWMKKHIDYKLERSESIVEHDFKNVDEIVKRGYAECRGYTLLFTALCRASDIPARPIWGMLRVPPGTDAKFGDIVSHNWAEVYIAGSGWLPIDPQRPETLGFLPTNYLRFAMDSRKSQNSTETLPVLNLMYMHADRLRFEERRVYPDQGETKGK